MLRLPERPGFDCPDDPPLSAEDIRCAAADEAILDPVGRSGAIVRGLLAEDGILSYADPYVLDEAIMWLARTRYDEGFPPDLARWLDSKFQDCAAQTDRWQKDERDLQAIEAHL